MIPEVNNKKPLFNHPKEPIMYFGRPVEEAILDYNTTENKVHRERVFGTIIYPALAKLVENVIHNRKFYDYKHDDYASVKHDCIVHLHERLSKYSLEKGKAFSYFNRIAINWIFAYQNRLAKERTLFLDFYSDDSDDHSSLHEIDRRRDLQQEESKAEYRSDLADFLLKWSLWGNDHLEYFYFVKDGKIVSFSLKDRRVANAIFDLCQQCHQLDNYDKKALYFYIRECVDCKTQTITDVINVLRPLQREMYLEYKRTGTRYWHRYLYYPEGICELSDEKLVEMMNEDKSGSVSQV